MADAQHRADIGRLLCVASAVAILGTSCGNRPATLPSPRPTSTPTDLPTVTPQAPSPDTTAAAFLAAWEEGDYGLMYALLSPESRASTTFQAFTQRYRSSLTTASVLTVTTHLQSVLHRGGQAAAAFAVTLDTALFGALTADATMPLSLGAGAWGIDWDAGLVWPQLAEGRHLHTTYSIPVRANIYDPDGLGLATQGTIVRLGVIPGQIENEAAVLQALTSITGLSADEIRSRYTSANPQWKIPIADIPAAASVKHNTALTSLSGVYREEKEGRTYPHGEAASHVVGWVAPVPAEELLAYRSRGYRGDEMVGVAGLEAWGEEVLAGQHGGTLTIITPDGDELIELAERPAVPGRSIYATLSRGFNEKIQGILGDRKGAIVVLDVRTGAVRGLVSGPGFDPNVLVGPVDAEERTDVLADPKHPLLNRATQGTYPTGSVFKIVTISAGMEAAGMDPVASTFYCPGYWDGLGRGARKYCWKESGHGDIILKDALTASCNVTFYNVGKTLYELGSDILPRFGSSYGLGELTGLLGLVEESGVMPSPEWKLEALGEPWYPGDTVNLAIGQGYLRVTPLQVARMMAAVANGGTLYRPFLVERIAGVQEEPEQVTEPEEVRSLPVTLDHLAAIQEALLGVTTESIGTAEHRFAGLSIPVAGKTGTAEAGGEDVTPHSWFAAYAPADDPEIALVVMVENAGEGSTVAAPLARQVVEAYYGLPLSPLPPQAEEDYVPPTPTPTARVPPTPTPTAGPSG